MINCFNQPAATELSLPSLKFLAIDHFETMASGFIRFDDESDHDLHPSHNEFERLAEPLETVLSTDNNDPKHMKLKPKRPLSAYNWFFASERKKILEDAPIRKEGKPRRSHGKIGFADLARSIAAKWKGLTKEERAVYDEKAAVDKDRYVREMEEWKKIQSIALSQMTNTNVDTYRNSISMMNEPIDHNTLTDPISSYLHNSLRSASPPENPLSSEMKMSAGDYFFNESYSLADAFGAQLSRRVQEGVPSTPPPVPSIPTTETSQISSSDNRETLETLASQLGDESTELFLNIFRNS